MKTALKKLTFAVSGMAMIIIGATLFIDSHITSPVCWAGAIAMWMGIYLASRLFEDV